MSIADEYASRILGMLADIENRYNDNYNRLGLLEQECNDIQHEIEFANFEIQRGYRLAKEFQKAKRERRALKAENETLFYLYEIVTKQPAIKSAFVHALTNIRRKQKEIDERTYFPRIRTDLPAINAMRDRLEAVKEVV
jgi:hypothetical protein